MRITVDWPDKRLSPNARLHWAKKEAARSLAIDEGYLKVKELGGETLDGELEIIITFHPPNRVRYDWDNKVASLKPTIDGMCRALGVDDSRIVEAKIYKREVIKGGLCHIEIKAIKC